MRAVLLLQCSPRSRRSISRAAAERVVDRLCARAPRLAIRRRDLGDEPPPAVDERFTEAMYMPAAAQSVAQRQALAHSEALISELEETDALVIGTPMHNFTVPAPLKAWIDQVLRVERTFRRTPQGKQGLLADRPAYVAVASGGWLLGERARQPDFLTPYLTAVLTTLGIRDIRFLHLEAIKEDPDSAARGEAHLSAWLDAHLPLAGAAAPVLG